MIQTPPSARALVADALQAYARARSSFEQQEKAALAQRAQQARDAQQRRDAGITNLRSRVAATRGQLRRGEVEVERLRADAVRVFASLGLTPAPRPASAASPVGVGPLGQALQAQMAELQAAHTQLVVAANELEGVRGKFLARVRRLILRRS